MASAVKAGKQRATAKGRAADDENARQLLAIVHDLAVELHPHLRRTLTVELDSDIDSDIGLDSLGRAELLLRIDRAFKVRLPERLIGEARTLRDLLKEVTAAAPDAGAGRIRTAIEPIVLPETSAPTQATTLIEVLAAHVGTHGERPHILLWRSDEEDEAITYSGLDRAARAVAGGLINRGLERGERVAIMLPTEAGFFHAFFGVLLSGGIPVPIYPPFRRAQVEDHLRRQAGILSNAQASFLVTDEEIHRVGVLLYGLTDSLRRVETVTELASGEMIGEATPADGGTTALIQYTSGSTGDPKGVVLSHANLIANIRAMGEVMEASSSDILVSWLPLYHDMGLIGAWFGCLYYGAPAVIMPPLAFLADPARWLWAIHRHRATLSAAPNFAFELCLKNIRDADIDGLDLSTLRMVVNGAEPVSPSTIVRFTEKFKAYGFRPEAMAPVYGLAESAVGLAFPPTGRAPIIDRVERESLSQRGYARPAEPDDVTALEFVACGQPLPNHEVRIVDATGREVAARHEGRLQFKGPSVTTGYFRNEEKTRALFDGDWLESGDLAYIVGGDIFLTGRIKDMIIRSGRNIYPHELEEHVGNIEGIRKGCVAAFASRDPRTGTERLIILAETRLADQAQLDELKQRISDASLELLNLPPDEIVLAPPHAVPKTSSGKIRRSQARSLYESGMIGRKARALWWQLARLSLVGLAHRFQRGGRIAVHFAYAAYWWCALCLISVFVWPLVVALPRRDWAHAVTGGLARLFLRLTGLAVDVEAEGPIPEKRVILVSNHSSYLDGMVISAAIPGKLSFVAKAELGAQLITGPFLRRLGTIFVRRTDASGGIEDTALTLKAAEAGERIVSFPEGTLTRMPGLLGFHLGAFLVAAQTGTPVIPVAIRGTLSVLRGGQWFPRRGAISVHIGTPIRVDGTDFEAAVRLRDAARAVILAHCGEPDLAREKISLTTAT
ncbi:MAG: AMP-binding protein [Hyphomicrobiales bacterium]|nr:AMP-binding protein [Hyphomicrobiales bacterium]